MADRRPTPRTRGFGGLVTQLIRLGGLVLALNEGLLHSSDPHLPIYLAVCAFMMAGATGLDRALDKLFGRDEP